ncbi:hypothetical protein [Candidatus Reidiella endopervernicosa]|uniref:Uncharacterized protein n=1 Tax=Candidatus Reidiella endopervernicosa TaxID=2738883 RepID=A0A6N0HVZ5_9GAMM|nr:hypothetical protein [Candidatus Reidiella endopervernicosa]QKQ26530.1 hypothetical protein HUE57_09735 [Candidatus Reidiella endopervernicosa]
MIPHGIDNLNHAIGAIGFNEWRVSDKGLVYLSSNNKWSMSFEAPRALNIMTSWFKSNGWEVEISSSGLIATQMLKQLEGVWGVGLLKRKGLIELLNKMSEGRALLKNAFWGEIQKL